MSAPVAYDLSRLLLRSFEPSPNGIDRVDINLARHFLAAQDANRGLLLHWLRPWTVGRAGAQALLDIVDEAWRENLELDADPAYRQLREALLGPSDRPAGRIGSGPAARPAGARTRLAFRLGAILAPQLAMLRRVPQDAVFIHATHFPSMQLFRWLDKRPDVKSVFLVHDLMPLKHPQYFTARNAAEHRQFLDVFVRYAGAAIVHAEAVKADVENLLQSRGAADKPILVAPMPVAPVFARAAAPDPALAAQPYFVVCGTIEPRKNHALLLDLWEDLARREGAKAPRLVVIGRRGWNNEAVFARLDRFAQQGALVLEATGLTTPAMRQIVAHARALLMPSFDEGYGLPVVEAQAAGTPVIVSDVPVLREIAGPRATFCRPDDRDAWREAIAAHAQGERRGAPPPMTPAENGAAWEAYFRTLSDFISAL